MNVVFDLAARCSLRRCIDLGIHIKASDLPRQVRLKARDHDHAAGRLIGSLLDAAPAYRAAFAAAALQHLAQRKANVP